MQIQVLENRTKSRSTTKSHITTATHTKTAIALFTLLITLTIAGCKFGLQEAFYRSNGVNERSSELSTITLPSNVTSTISTQSGKYNFMILTDVHYGAGYDIPETQILNWIDSFNATTQSMQRKPLFCLVLGDMAETGDREEFAAFNSFQDKIEAKGIPVYCIVGNHDLLNSGWKYWKTSCNPGTSFYKFSTSALSFYFTDTGSGTMGTKQLSALENAFKSDNNRKLVFTHYALYGGGAGLPLFCIGNDKERGRIIDLCARNNVKYTFEGHYHPGGEYDFGNFKELVATSLKQGKWYLVSIDETTGNSANPVTKVTEIDLNSF